MRVRFLSHLLELSRNLAHVLCKFLHLIGPEDEECDGTNDGELRCAEPEEACERAIHTQQLKTAHSAKAEALSSSAQQLSRSLRRVGACTRSAGAVLNMRRDGCDRRLLRKRCCVSGLAWEGRARLVELHAPMTGVVATRAAAIRCGTSGAAAQGTAPTAALRTAGRTAPGTNACAAPAGAPPAPTPTPPASAAP